MKRIISAFLAVMILISMTISVTATETAEVTEETEAVLNAAPPQHKKPTNLRWHEVADGSERYCSMSWDSVPETNNRYQVKLWRDGELLTNTSYSSNANKDTGRVDFGGLGIYFNKSGTYQFAVASKGDNKNYSDSDFVYSTEFKYTVPTKKAPGVTNVKWDKNGVLTHNGVEDAYGFVYVEYYTCEAEGETLIPAGGNSGSGGSQMDYPQSEDCSQDILDAVNDFEKVTGYYLKIYTIPNDLKTCTYSDPVLTPKYDVLHLRNFAGEGALDILGNYNASKSDANEMKDELLDYLADNNLGATELALALSDNYNVENAIHALDVDYQNENNIQTKVSDSSDGYAESLGINTDDIVIKGAALNAAKSNSTVTLEIAEPSTERTPSAAFFDNCNVFSLTLDGVSDSTSLDIPVLIYLPVPETLDVWSTVILHYKKDGTYEVLSGKPQYMNGSQYIAFSVTGFSDFVLCTSNSANDLNYDGIVNGKDIMYYINFMRDAIMQGWFGGGMTGSLDLNNDSKFNMKDLNDLVKLFREAM